MIREVTGVLKPAKVPSNHGQSLRVACAIFGIGTAQLAREFDVTAPAVDKWKGTMRWNKERLELVADFFGMHPDAFEELAYRALSESVNCDAVALSEHLREYHPDKTKQAAQIKRQYDKIVNLLREIEGYA